MTKFSDQLFDDLMHEHGPALAHTRSPAHRARRRIPGAVSGLAVVTAAAVVLGLGLSGAFGSAPARGTGTIRTAAFTLVEHANGTATLTIKPGELLDAAALQNDLHQDGIPALVTSGSFCSSDPAPAGFSQVVSFSPAPTPGNFALPPRVHPHPTITFNPAAIPSGAELSFGIFQQQADFELISTSSHTCTSTPPPAPADGAQYQLGPAGS
jgi:hypothetical protein